MRSGADGHPGLSNGRAGGCNARRIRVRPGALALSNHGGSMPSPNVRVSAIALVLASSLAAQAYESNFEALNASAAGTLLSGQDNYYLPAVAGSVDWNAF